MLSTLTSATGWFRWGSSAGNAPAGSIGGDGHGRIDPTEERRPVGKTLRPSCSPMRPDQPARLNRPDHRGELRPELRTLRGVHQRHAWCHRRQPPPLRECCAFFYFFLLALFFPPLVVSGGWAVLCVSRPLPFENLTCPGQKNKGPRRSSTPKKLGVAIYIFNMKALRI